MKKKRKDECLFCTSRKCGLRIFRKDNPHFDEIACIRHYTELEMHADEVLGGRGSGVMRTHMTTTGTYFRGQE